MGSISAGELAIIAVVLIVLFGASRLPATAKGLGQALRVFKKELRDDDQPIGEEPAADPGTPELTTGTETATATSAAMTMSAAGRADRSTSTERTES